MNARTEAPLAAPAARAIPRGDAVLAASDAVGLAFLAAALGVTVLGLALAASAHWLPWLAGQAILACAFLQWFILLHEAAHLSLFRTRGLNLLAGHLAGAMALIPFESWRRVHGLHHLWTGWQDLDPTTASLAPRPRGRIELALVDLAWRCWLPLFSLAYRLGNYWNLPRLARLFQAASQRRAIIVNALVLVAAYGLLVWTLEPQTVLRLVGLALLLGLALQDPLILSQHTHIPQLLSRGEKVTPLTAAEQETYTRSLRFPRWVAQWLLMNFNAHELHHRYVAVPGYRLGRIAHQPANEVDWWTWLKAAKRLRGSVFLFQNRDSTGLRE